MWLKDRTGSSLIEVLVVVTILSFVLIAMLNASMVAIIQTKFARSQTLANRYSQQAIDWMRAKRDNYSQWDDFVNNVFGVTTGWNGGDITDGSQVIYCLPALNLTYKVDNEATCADTAYFITGTKFIRVIILTAQKTTTPGQVQVEVKTKWRDGLCASSSQPFCHQAKIVTLLSQWNLN